jgi:hypothetical protein
MKKVMLLTIFAALMMISSAAVAQAGSTASGTLNVTATVNGSINLVFNKDAVGLALSLGAGTNAATLDFGNVSAFSLPLAAGLTRTTTLIDFTISTPVDVVVTKFNSTSPPDTLQAQLTKADGFNSGQVGATNVTSTAAATISGSLTYGAVAEAVSIRIPFTTASGTVISNTINYIATSN